eukprot:m.575167 g.575167  ORF g.575167 m.575167 type:complete len:60 (+) comp57890_c0_seq1:64-243(+)
MCSDITVSYPRLGAQLEDSRENYEAKIVGMESYLLFVVALHSLHLFVHSGNLLLELLRN